MTLPDTVGAAFDEASRRLSGAGISSARLDARVLMSSVLGLDQATLYGHPERPLSAGEGAHLAGLVARRESREPLAQILGRREFWSLPMAVTAETLIPRPETETLVEAALDRLSDSDAGISILDLGTGSGCLLLALLSELPAAWGVGVDISAAALATAAANAQSLGLAERSRFVLADWGSCLHYRFDLIVANPPYIGDGELAGLAPEVAAFEPRQALMGGPDGMDAYRALLPQLCGLLATDGAVFLEIGAGQGVPVATMIQHHGLQLIDVKRDLSKIERCLVIVPGRR